MISFIEEIDMQIIIHYILHFGFPFIISYIFFRDKWKYAGLVMLLTMFVDLDHLFASPVFDPQRCSIGFHPLHSFWAIGAYTIAVFFRHMRIIAVGLLFHMFTDLIDCIWTFHKCYECYINSELYPILNYPII
jgi:hypothetical protein